MAGYKVPHTIREVKLPIAMPTLVLQAGFYNGDIDISDDTESTPEKQEKGKGSSRSSSRGRSPIVKKPVDASDTESISSKEPPKKGKKKDKKKKAKKPETDEETEDGESDKPKDTGKTKTKGFDVEAEKSSSKVLLPGSEPDPGVGDENSAVVTGQPDEAATLEPPDEE